MITGSVFESGVNSYEELDIRLMKAKERVVRSTGEEGFREMLARLPLTPSDESVEAIAAELGWQEEFMTISRANLPIPVSRLRPPVGNHEVPQMFRAQRAVARAAAVPAAALPAHHPALRVPEAAPLEFGSGPLPAVPPPRPNLRRLPAAPAAAPATVSKAASPVEPGPGPVVASPNVNGNDVNLNGNDGAAGASLSGNGGANLNGNAAGTGGANLNGNGGPDGNRASLNGNGASGTTDDADRPICAVCQDYIVPGSTDVSVFDCGHVFHQLCIARWRRASNNAVLRCPVCRQPTPEADDWVIPQDVDDDEEQGVAETNGHAEESHRSAVGNGNDDGNEAAIL